MYEKIVWRSETFLVYAVTETPAFVACIFVFLTFSLDIFMAICIKVEPDAEMQTLAHSTVANNNSGIRRPTSLWPCVSAYV